MHLNNHLMKMNALLIVMLMLFSCENDKPVARDKEDVYVTEALYEDRSEEGVNVLMDRPYPADEKLIKMGSLEMKVSDLGETKVALAKILKTVEARTTAEMMRDTEDRKEMQLTIRVPAHRFDSLMMALEKLALRVDQQNISTDNVTEEFIDVEARLRTKRELENRYRELLQQARSVADLLAIEGQLASVRGEIESMEGRLKYLNDEVAMSTIQLTYYEALGVDFGFGGKFVTSLQEGWDNLLGFMIFLVRIWPFTIMVGVGGIWLVRKTRRRPA